MMMRLNCKTCGPSARPAGRRLHRRPGPGLTARRALVVYVAVGACAQTGVVLNVISCFLLSGYTAGAFQAVYGEPPFALPAWANATA